MKRKITQHYEKGERKVKHSLILLFSLILTCSKTHANQNSSLEFSNLDFNHIVPVEPASSPYNTLLLPEKVLALLQSDNLSDLQLLNTHGESIPIDKEFRSSKTHKIDTRTLAFFPFNEKSIANKDSQIEPLAFSYQSGEFSIRVKDKAKHPDMISQDPKANTVIIDTRPATEELSLKYLSSLNLEFDQSYKGLSLLSLDTSDDLNNWTSIAKNLSVAKLDGQSTQLSQSTIPLDSPHKRFIKLHWLSKNFPEIRLISGIAERELEEFNYEWSTALPLNEINSDTNKAFAFQLAPAFNSSALKFSSKAKHPIYTGSLYLKNGETWRHYSDFQFSSDQQANEQDLNKQNIAHKIPLNKPLNRPPNAVTHWKIEFSYPQASLQAEDFELNANYRIAKIYFINDNAVPYHLAFGSSNYRSSIRSKDPVFTHSHPKLAYAKLGVIKHLEQAKPGYDWMRLILWLVLTLAVALIFSMSFKLYKEFQKNTE